MKAQIYEGPYQFSLKDIPKPQAGAGQVLVRVRAVGACGSDVHGFAGKTGRRYPGMVMGHEIAGEVAELGTGVSGLKTGQHVVVQPIIFCGKCEMCKAGKTSVCLNKKMVGVNMDTTGGLTEYIAIPADRAMPIAEKVPFALGALVEPLAVGAGAVSCSSIKEGDIVAIVGSGMIGLAILVMALKRKPSKVFIVDQAPKKLDLAEKLGATAVNLKKTDPVKFILDATAGRGVDVAIEAVGITPTVQTAQAVTKTGGEIVWVGNSQRMIEVDMQDLVVKAKRITGIYCYTDKDFRQAITYVEENSKQAEVFAEEIVDFSETQKLFTALGKGEKELLRGVVTLD